jgi:hypothetical protein
LALALPPPLLLFTSVRGRARDQRDRLVALRGQLIVASIRREYLPLETSL